MPDTVLDGCRVLDLSDEKGLFCGKLLAELGAEVVRIEKPGPAARPDEVNAGKRSISLNIEMAEGRELFRRLIKISDVLIESFPPGYLQKQELDYGSLSGLNPRLIMASITHFGQTGPWRQARSSELVSSALGGQVFVCGDRDGPPLKPFGPQAYYTACLFAANGILLALWQRHKSDKGQYLDISVHECTAAALDHQLVRYFYTGEVAQRNGSLYWNGAFRIFPCRDGYILLSLHYQWETLVEWLESEGMAGDLDQDRWRDEAVRRQNNAHIIEMLEKWTLAHTVDDLLETGQLMHFPWARVAALPDVVENPQLKARGFFPDVTDPETGRTYKYPGAPFIMDRSPLVINPAIPTRGEYNTALLQRKLGLSAPELEKLVSRGVI
jgi:crotonobetainyl-CoA:carnitine CoA-transferase CaiB-like acyl-CoA transferase